MRADWWAGTCSSASRVPAAWPRFISTTPPHGRAAGTNQRIPPPTGQLGRHFHTSECFFERGSHSHLPAAQAHALMTRPIPRPRSSCARGAHLSRNCARTGDKLPTTRDNRAAAQVQQPLALRSLPLSRVHPPLGLRILWGNPCGFDSRRSHSATKGRSVQRPSSCVSGTGNASALPQRREVGAARWYRRCASA